MEAIWNQDSSPDAGIILFKRQAPLTEHQSFSNSHGEGLVRSWTKREMRASIHVIATLCSRRLGCAANSRPKSTWRAWPQYE